MDTDVAAFARQLRQDGIEASKADAERILAEAHARATEMQTQAQEAAAAFQAEARAAIGRERQRFAIELGMAARDTMLRTRQDIERVVMRLLRARIGGALAADDIVRKAIAELIGGAARGSAWEIAVGPGLGKALVDAAVSDLLKGREGAIAVVEEFGRSGLEFRAAEGGEVLELSEASVAEAFRRLISPELARIVDSQTG